MKKYCKFTCFRYWVHMSPSCQHVFFAIIVQNLMKLHLYVVQSCLVVFSLVKVIDGRKNVVKFAILSSIQTFGLKLETAQCIYYIFGTSKLAVMACIDMRGLKLTSKLAVMACMDMRGLKLTSKLAVMACWEPETDVQTLHSPWIAIIRHCWREASLFRC